MLLETSGVGSRAWRASQVRLLAQLVAAVAFEGREGTHVFFKSQRSHSGLSFVCSGLDPSEPYFQGTSAAVSLDVTDATFVDVIHTDGRPFNSKLGIHG